jgi:transcriptional regulator with XRE-family HTH domain
MITLAKWFEKDYIKYMDQFGRSTIEDYADYLGLSQGYVSQLMSGKRVKVSQKKSREIANKRNDFTILDIQGYARPDHKFLTLDHLPEDLQSRLRFALDEIELTLRTRAIQPDSPEGEAISSSVLKKYLFNTNENE